MAFEGPNMPFGQLTAATNLSSDSHRWRAVKSTGNNTMRLSSAVTQPCLGILQEPVSSGRAGQVIVFGVSKARVLSTAHTAINAGDKIVASASGGVRASTGTTVGHYVLGRALTGIAANLTGIIDIFITHQGAGSTGTQGAP